MILYNNLYFHVYALVLFSLEHFALIAAGNKTDELLYPGITVDWPECPFSAEPHTVKEESTVVDSIVLNMFIFWWEVCGIIKLDFYLRKSGPEQS